MIVERFRRTGSPPTMPEIGERLGVSRQRAFDLVSGLRVRGLVRADTVARQRGAIPTDDGFDWIAALD